jgi:mono/diheme cytochrome c family protein
LKTESSQTFRSVLAAVLALGALAAAGCRNNMHTQNKVKTYRPSPLFADGASARPLPAHTVARGDLREDEAAFTGLRGNVPVNTLPFPVTREVLLRGRQRFEIFCSPCHDRTGGGRGMIVERGYKQPPSYQEERLRNAPLGYFFSVMTLGYGVMPSYAVQVSVADRWAIAAYIRVLQYSQGARLAELPPAARQAVESDLRNQEAQGAAGPRNRGAAGHQPAAAAPQPHEVP